MEGVVASTGRAEAEVAGADASTPPPPSVVESAGVMEAVAGNAPRVDS